MTDRDSTERVSWSAGVHIAIPLTPHTLSLHATNAPIATLQDASRGTSTIRYGFEFTIPLTLKRYFGKRAKSAPDTVVSTLAAPQVDTAATVEKPAGTTVPAPNPAAIVEPIAPTVTLPAATVPPADTTKKSSAPVKAANAPAPKSAAPKPAARTAAVRRTTIKNISYLQPKITVTVGTTVEWTNADPLQHTVTAVDKSFNSGLINPGKTFRHTFTKAGTFNFYCMPHPFMKGVIVVTDK
jgi:plastocyanin